MGTRNAGIPPEPPSTSLVDENRYPADELRTLYPERWEAERGLGEMKADMLEADSKQEPVERSK